MMDLKKLLAFGAFCSVGVMACDSDTKDLGTTVYCDDAGTIEEICVSDDAGMETCGCPGAETDLGVGRGGGNGGGGEGGTGELPAPTATAEWTDSKTLVVTVTTHADLGPYGFGFAETGNGMDGWDGEDCLEGTKDDFDICHSIPEDGVLTLTSIHPEEGGMLSQLVEDETTLMNKAREDGITYMILRSDAESGMMTGCWTWGHNPQHYLDEGCNAL